VTRVLVSTSTFPVRPDDGLPRFVHDLAAALAGEDEVWALAPHAPGAPRRERLGALEVERFTYFWPPRLQRLAYGSGMRENLRAAPWAWSQVPGFVLAQARAVARLVRTRRIEVVNSHWLVPQGLSAALARAAGARFAHVLSVHAGDVYLIERLAGGAALARGVLARTEAVLADGSHVRASLDRLLGRPSGAALEPMGVELARFAVGPSPVAGEGLVFVGRLVEKKGVVHLLRALPAVLARRPAARLTLVGDGPLRAGLEAEARALGVGAAVRFAGQQPHVEVARHLGASRVAVVPSVIDRWGETDGMPTVVLEAMAAGLPVVGSDVDGIPDVIRPGVNGFLCRPGDPADLADKLVRALESPEALRAAARATAATHAWSEVAARYRVAFARALAAREVGS
jgi:glycosyltransferase involved in cell wall biosynthesis